MSFTRFESQSLCLIGGWKISTAICCRANELPGEHLFLQSKTCSEYRTYLEQTTLASKVRQSTTAYHSFVLNSASRPTKYSFQLQPQQMGYNDVLIQIMSLLYAFVFLVSVTSLLFTFFASYAGLVWVWETN